MFEIDLRDGLVGSNDENWEEIIDWEYNDMDYGMGQFKKGILSKDALSN